MCCYLTMLGLDLQVLVNVCSASVSCMPKPQVSVMRLHPAEAGVGGVPVVRLLDRDSMEPLRPPCRDSTIFILSMTY
jgi:hypothetical protein